MDTCVVKSNHFNGWWRKRPSDGFCKSTPDGQWHFSGSLSLRVKASAFLPGVVISYVHLAEDSHEVIQNSADRLRTALAAIAPSGIAHFGLLEPASWLQENQLGDPGKRWAPCGGTSADPGKPTDKITTVQGGEKLHVKIQETVFHPGFYRVALAVNSRDELPKDPRGNGRNPPANGPRSVSAAIHVSP